MRDSFDTYFLGWTLDLDEPAPAPGAFADLVQAVGTYVTSDAEAGAAWRAFPLDGKKECFFHFLKLARAAGALPPGTAPLLARLQAEFPRSLG
jgi:hypothetical protein